MKSFFSPSWRTSIGAIMSAVGGVLVQVNEPSWCKTLGQILIAAGPTIIGLNARDNMVSTEQAKAK